MSLKLTEKRPPNMMLSLRSLAGQMPISEAYLENSVLFLRIIQLEVNKLCVQDLSPLYVIELEPVSNRYDDLC